MHRNAVTGGVTSIQQMSSTYSNDLIVTMWLMLIIFTITRIANQIYIPVSRKQVDRSLLSLSLHNSGDTKRSTCRTLERMPLDAKSDCVGLSPQVHCPGDQWLLVVFFVQLRCFYFVLQVSWLVPANLKWPPWLTSSAEMINRDPTKWNTKVRTTKALGIGCQEVQFDLLCYSRK